MAERRMFTKKVTDDDHFIELSASAQALYLHLSMSADDDGFCNQVSASMFKAHASVQDLEALLSKRYVYQFENGVIVIKHWRMANALRKDRYTPTAFQEELANLEVSDNGSYSWLPDGCQMVANWLPSGCRLVATGKDRLDKDSIGKDSIDVDSPPPGSKKDRFDAFWEAYPKKVGKGAARKSFEKAVKKCSVEKMIEAVEHHKLSREWTKNNGQYIPNPATWLNQERWDDQLSGGEHAREVEFAAGSGSGGKDWGVKSDLE